MNERITEGIVRDHFKADPRYNDVEIEEQKSKNHRIEKLLKNASKSGNGAGKPEFIISLKNSIQDYIMVIECKADLSKHESKTRDNYKDYAVDGVLLYSSFLSKEFDVLSIAVSGEDENNLKISHFLQLKDQATANTIFGDKLLSIENYLNYYSIDDQKFNQDYQELLRYSITLNEYLHSKKVKESQRSLLISGILIALNDGPFEAGYRKYEDREKLVKSGYTEKETEKELQKSTQQLADNLVNTIKNQLSNKLNKDKAENLAISYSFIKTHTALSKEIGVLKGLIKDIDENVNSFVKTYRYFDVLGQFYIEFLKYANNDKGLGIVLTPPHITEFFVDLAMVNKNSVLLDNCAGTGGFLISGMKKMILEAKGDEKKITEIKEKQIVGIEYQDDIFALTCSNMYIHKDGKSNIIHGDCFNIAIIDKVKREFKPNVGFLNPPYKTEKTDRYELEFILNNISMLEKGSMCISIIPISCALAQKGQELELKKKILKDNTLEAVFSMPNELFFNSDVGTITCIMVIKAHQPHPDDYETYFGYCKDDGFIKRKPLGRGDYLNKWNDIKNEWIYNYKNKKEIKGHSVKRCVTAEDEWCAEAYLETGYDDLTPNLFELELKKYAAFQILKGD